MDSNDKVDETLPGIEGDPTPVVPQENRPLFLLAESYLKAGIFSGKAPRIFEEISKTALDRPEFPKALEICRLVQTVAETLRARAGDTPAPTPPGNQREVVERLFGQFPGSPDLAKCLGDVRLLDGNWEGATHAYRLAQSKGYRDDQLIVDSGRLTLNNPECPAPIFRYFGELALSLGQFPEAVEFLVRTLRASLYDREASIALLELLADKLLLRLEESPEKQLLLAEIVRACLELGLMERAMAAFRLIHIDGAKHSDLVKAIGRFLIDQEDYRQAFDYLTRIPCDRETKTLVNEITEKLEQRGEIDTAVYLLQYVNENDLVVKEAQKVHQENLEAQATRELADLCFRAARYDAALMHYLTLVRRNLPGITEFADRIETSALQTTRPPIDDLIYIGEFFFRKADWRRAESLLNRVIDLDLGNTRARELLRAIYDAMLKAEPNLGRVRLKSGDLYLNGNRIEEAIGEYQKVLESPGYENEARRRLAVAYARLGEYPRALEQYRVLQIKTIDCEMLYQIHENLMAENLLDQALDSLALIAQFDQQYRDVGERMRGLEQMLRSHDSGQQALRDPKMVELIGEQAVGRYRYVEQIGSGGMGVVHKVFDIKNQFVVAMKILRDSLTGSSKAIDRFFREARIAATLSHPNIVNIFDYNINNVFGKSYISMEYVDGPSLRDIIEKRFAQTAELTHEYIAEILYYSGQLCDALETTHLKGIIHRDIKPDNVMINSKRQVKITDFGIVHIEEATFTPTGALIGTPRYMSPEQVRGGRVDCRSDIYAVGIILYESLIGTPPFISGDIAYQHVNVLPVPPRELNPTIPDEVERVIMRCLEKDPKQRFQRSREVKAALEEVLDLLYAETVLRLQYTPLAAVTTFDSPQQATE